MEVKRVDPGTWGTADGEFKYPVGVAVTPDGGVYIVDQGNHRIQKFTTDGEFVSKWGTEGEGDGQFLLPVRIAVAPDGSVYVSDGTNKSWPCYVWCVVNHRIQKFSPGE